MKTRVYTVSFRLVVPAGADPHLRSPHAIREELTSWLSDLGATVEDVRVTRSEQEARRS